MRSVVLVALLSSACTPAFEETEVNRGRACVYASPNVPEDELQDYGPLLGPGAPHAASSPAAIVVRVDIPCVTDYAAECTVEATSPNDLVIRSVVSWTRSDGLCTREAKYAYATCLTPVLSSQSYAIQFGEQRGSFEVPGPAGQCLEE